MTTIKASPPGQNFHSSSSPTYNQNNTRPKIRLSLTHTKPPPPKALLFPNLMTSNTLPSSTVNKENVNSSKTSTDEEMPDTVDLIRANIAAGTKNILSAAQSALQYDSDEDDDSSSLGDNDEGGAAQQQNLAVAYPPPQQAQPMITPTLHHTQTDINLPHRQTFTIINAQPQLAQAFVNPTLHVNARGGPRTNRAKVAKSPRHLEAEPSRWKPRITEEGSPNEIRDVGNGNIEVLLNGEWLPAILHHEFVKKLDRRAIDPNRYTYKRAEGKHHDDFTSYLEEQKDWGKERSQRPAVLFELHEPHGPHLLPPSLRFIDANNKSHLVIDSRMHLPLRHFPNLPISISTKVEGWLMEAWERQNHYISLDDYLQRMPSHSYTGTEQEHHRINRRKENFRQGARCLSWMVKEHRSIWAQKLLAEMDAHPEWIRANTTRYLADLTVAQRKAVESELKESGNHKLRGRRNGARAKKAADRAKRRAGETPEQDDEAAADSDEPAHFLDNGELRPSSPGPIVTRNMIKRTASLNVNDTESPSPPPKKRRTSYRRNDPDGLEGSPAVHMNREESLSSNQNSTPVHQNHSRTAASPDGDSGFAPIPSNPSDASTPPGTTRLPVRGRGRPKKERISSVGSLDLSSAIGTRSKPLFNLIINTADGRFINAKNPHDRWELLIALFPTLTFLVGEMKGASVNLSLSSSYAVAWDNLQQQYSDFKKKSSTKPDEQELPEMPCLYMWKGGPADWYLAGRSSTTGPTTTLADAKILEQQKANSCHYELSPKVEKEMQARGMIKDGKIKVPAALTMQLNDIPVILDYERWSLAPP